jgi:hypothetical protein
MPAGCHMPALRECRSLHTPPCTTAYHMSDLVQHWHAVLQASTVHVV